MYVEDLHDVGWSEGPRTLVIPVKTIEMVVVVLKNLNKMC